MSKNQDLGELINGIKALATNQLNAPAYTSATAFTGTIAGYLGFDTSGNILTTGASSQWTTLGSNIYYNSGNVGIGTSTPDSLLVVQGGTINGFVSSIIANSTFTFGSTNGKRLSVFSNTQGDKNGIQIGFDSVDGTGIIAGSTESAGAGIDFYTYNSGSWGNRMRISKNGNIGIGVYSPAASLHLTNSTTGTPSIPSLGTINNYVAQYITNGVGGGSYGLMIGTLFSGNAYFQVQRSDGTATAYNILLQPNGGNVGIGTLGPSYKLDVAGDVNVTGSFRVNGTPIGTGGGGVSGSGTTNYLSKWSAGTALTNSQIFDNGSSIGLRTASPFYVIDYQLTGSLRLGYFIGSIDGTDNASGIVAHNGNGITQTVPFGFSGSKFAWYVGTNEAMRIDTNRNLLINTTGGVSGAGALQVNGDVNVTGTFKVNGVQYNTGGGGGNISGSGSTNYVPKFTGSTSLGDSALYDDGNFSMIIGATGFSSGIFMRASKYLGVYGASSSGIVLRTADGDPNVASVITREQGAGQGLSIYDDRQIWLGQSGLLTVVNISNNAVGIKTPAVGTPYALNLPNDYLNAARAYAWYTYSDERIKRDIEEISYGINDVMKMKPVRYKHYSSVFENNSWTLENNYTTEIGFVAQDMDKIISEVVNRGSDKELWSLDKSKLIPVLVKAIQELKSELDIIKSNIA
jgi:hypothetical protein